MKLVKILDNIEVAHDVYVLEFKRIFNFLPGQVINIEIFGNPPRIYSIASGDKDENIKILYDIKREGKVTPAMRKLQKGDAINISDPFGNFCCNKDPAVWIANGTGIAPFYSMFLSGLGQGKTLIHGGRTNDSFYFRDEFIRGFNDQYIRCSSRDKIQGAYMGRLTTYLREQINLPSDQKYYLCGSSEMVVEVRDILISKKIPFTNIEAEIYF